MQRLSSSKLNSSQHEKFSRVENELNEVLPKMAARVGFVFWKFMTVLFALEAKFGSECFEANQTEENIGARLNDLILYFYSNNANQMSNCKLANRLQEYILHLYNPK